MPHEQGPVPDIRAGGVTAGHSQAKSGVKPLLTQPPLRGSPVTVETPLWGSRLSAHFYSQLWLWHLLGASAGSLEVLMPLHHLLAFGGAQGLQGALERSQGRGDLKAAEHQQTPPYWPWGPSVLQMPSPRSSDSAPPGLPPTALATPSQTSWWIPIL